MLIKRTQYLEKIRRFYESNLIKVLTGVRRCGKSVLLTQIKDELISEKKISEDYIITINFEDIRFSKIKNFNKLNDYILKKINDNNKYYIFLDEIQHIKQFEKVLASLKATQNVSIFVTGSNSKILSGKLASLLVGRCKEFKIMPFTYSEFVKYYEENKLELPKKPLQNFIRFGGMPQRMDYVLEEDIKEYLKSIYYGIIEKDICNAKSMINKETFITISKYIINNTAKEFSAQSIVDYYNLNNPDKIYRKTVYRYLEKLEQACLISRVKRYDIAAKRTLKQIEKQFVVDKIDLLKMMSVIDYPTSDSYSKYFRLGFENNLFSENTELNPVIEFGLGMGKKVSSTTFYILPKIGYHYHNFSNFYLLPQIGTITRISDKAKIINSYERYFNSKKDNKGFEERYNLYFGYKMKNDTELYIDYSHYSKAKHSESLSLGIALHF